MSLHFNLYYEIDNNRIEVFSKNITHNLNHMADAAGIYDVLWEADNKGYIYGKDIVPILKKGLKDLKAKPDHYKQFNSPNGWGMYEHFVPFVEAVLEACKQYPNAYIEADK
jgi:hypothetical protein